VKAPKAARRNSFTPALGDKICDLMGEGKSLRFICSLEGMPTRQAVNKWLHKGESADAPKPFKDFVVQYIRAREKLADFYAESISDIADEGMRDADEVEDKLVGHFKAAARRPASAQARGRWFIRTGPTFTRSLITTLCLSDL
jgi:hypothetical protein